MQAECQLSTDHYPSIIMTKEVVSVVNSAVAASENSSYQPSTLEETLVIPLNSP